MSRRDDRNRSPDGAVIDFSSEGQGPQAARPAKRAEAIPAMDSIDRSVSPIVARLLAEHRGMLGLVQRARLAVIDGDLAAVRSAHAELRQLLDGHASLEESTLLPHVPAAARWQPVVYLAEHRRIEQLAAGLRRRLADTGPLDGPTRLALLDAHHPLVHLLEHHFEREEQELFAAAASG